MSESRPLEQDLLNHYVSLLLFESGTSVTREFDVFLYTHSLECTDAGKLKIEIQAKRKELDIPPEMTWQELTEILIEEA